MSILVLENSHYFQYITTHMQLLINVDPVSGKITSFFKRLEHTRPI